MCVFVCTGKSAVDSVLEVVAYEARRLFRDRIVSSKDLNVFDNILSSIIRGDWGSDALDNMTGHTYTHTHTHWFPFFVGTLHRRNGFYTVQTVFSIALHQPYT